jgi:ParB family chromosome partitioning protein
LRKKPKLDLGINAYEELFMNENERNVTRLPKIYDIPIELIDDFPSHPFKVKMDEDMENLVASIEEQGLITPVILRPKDDGRYEMVSGHRRKEACLLAGLTTIKAEVREITQDEAIILMVDSNLQRTMILPSEKAFSYKMRLEALRRLPGRPKKNGDPVGHLYRGEKSVSVIAEESPDSKTQIQRYIRLTELIPELLDLVDERKMALRPAVELSFLTPEEQKVVYEETTIRDCMPSHAQTIRMRKLSERNLLTDSAIDDIMREEKPNQVDKIHIPYNEIRKYIPKGVSYEKTADFIKTALIFYQEHHFQSQE